MDGLILNETKNFKILIIGVKGAGKTSLTKWNDKEVPNEIEPSSVSEFTVKNIMFEGFEVTLQLWDIVFDNMVSKSFLRGTNGIILVTDLTSQDSLYDTEDLFHKIMIISGLDRNDSFPFIIVGNKLDLLDTRSREISQSMLNEWKQKICPINKNVIFFEISAKSGYNVNEMFNAMLKMLFNKSASTSQKSINAVESATIQSNSANDTFTGDRPTPMSMKAKVVLAGKTAVGKTCILSRNSSDDRTIYSTETYTPTTGTDFRVIDVPIANQNISLQIWDSAGSNISKAIYKSADCLILVYDISSRESFIDLEAYWEHFMRYAQPTDVYEFPVLLVGNKCDLDSKRAVHIEEVMEWCANKRPRKPISYVECSALLNMGVRDVFLFIAEAMYEYKIYVIDEYIYDDNESGLDTTNYEHYDDSKSSHYSNSNFGTDYTIEDVYDELFDEKKMYSSPKHKHPKTKDGDIERNCFVEFLKELNCL